jgi:membrane associated rhomboid family serine protease
MIIFIVFFRIFAMPAWIVLGVWFGLQMFSSLNTTTDMGGVAYWAHAGGFVAGVLMALPLWRKRGGTGYWSRTAGRPPHPDAQYRYSASSVPRVGRRR